MHLRKARNTDVSQIRALINEMAMRTDEDYKHGHMLPRSLTELYEHIRDYTVVVNDEDRVMGCCALESQWDGLAELKALAVHDVLQGQGWGRKLVDAVISESDALGIACIYTLTNKMDFFTRLDFHPINMRELPQRVWSECVNCSKYDAGCDEVAMTFQGRRPKQIFIPAVGINAPPAARVALGLAPLDDCTDKANEQADVAVAEAVPDSATTPHSDGFAPPFRSLDNVNDEIVSQVENSGFALIQNAVGAEVVQQLQEAIGNAMNSADEYSMRHVLERVPAVREWCDAPTTRALVEPILGENCFPVRALLFDKTPDANWKVVWHQDLTIAVREKVEVDGFVPWSKKEDVWHVQPPVRILENMLALRLHLDNCDEENGPLRVLPGSHLAGKLDADAIARWRESENDVPCLLESGGVLLMRPLLLHASSQAVAPRHRRVLHIEWANEELPNGLQWFSAS